MKRIISLFMIAALLCMTASAMGMRYTFEDVCAEIEFPEGYRVLTEDNLESNDKLLEELGYTKTGFAQILQSEVAYAVAFSADLDTEIWFQVYTSEETSQAFDMDDFTAEDRDIYISSVTADTTYIYSTADFIDGENGVFFRTERTDGERFSVTYLTIKNGAYYSITLQKKSEGELSTRQLDDAKRVYQGLTFTEVQENPNKTSATKKFLVILCMGLLSASAFAIAVVVLKRMGYIGKKKPGVKSGPKRIKLKK